MTDLLHRATPADLEIRSGGDGRTICGIACPIGEPAQVADRLGRPYTETMARGAFQRTIAERGDRVKARAMHNQTGFPIGKATILREDAAGLYAELHIAQTQAGDEALELVRSGVVGGLSIGFRPVRDDWNASRTEVSRLEVALHEISIVDEAAYAGAVITGVRSATSPTSPDVLMQRIRILARSF